MNAWAHLPNAVHIDRVLASVTANPELWSAACAAVGEVAWRTARDATRDADRVAAWEAAWDVAWRAVMSAAREAAREAAWVAAWEAAWVAARDAIIALVAYDDCSHMLDSDVDEVRILAALGVPAAMLLLPACIVFAKEKELA